MPNCKSCGSRLSKFDKDICPICGCVNPLKNVTSETIEITSEISLSSEAFNYKAKERFIAFILFFLCGFLGIGYFYLAMPKKGFIWLGINVAFILGLGFLLSLPLKFGYLLGFVVTIIIVILINTIIGLYYLLKKDIKDGRGEFLK